MCFPAEKKDDKYTYGDYLTWPEDERWEIINGVAYDMTPAPSTSHQRILGELHKQFAIYLTDKECEVFFAPFDVRIPYADEKDEQIKIVVQPDLIVICDKAKLDEKGCRGTPDLVMEILSPSTAPKDMKEKFSLYEKAGVREYWIVYPEERVISVFTLDAQGKYGRPEVYTKEDTAAVGIFSGDLVIDLKPVFRE